MAILVVHDRLDT